MPLLWVKGNEIIQHPRRREAKDRKDAKGQKLLGGTKSVLHREVPYKQSWALMKDGDLWEVFTDLVKIRGPQTVWITKVKGHATQEMVDEGKVEQEDMRGNSMVDRAVDLGAIECQKKVHKYGEMFCWRQNTTECLWPGYKGSSWD